MFRSKSKKFKADSSTSEEEEKTVGEGLINVSLPKSPNRTGYGQESNDSPGFLVRKPSRKGIPIRLNMGKGRA